MAGLVASGSVGQECCPVSLFPDLSSSVPNEPFRYVAGTVLLTSRHKCDQARCLSWVAGLTAAKRHFRVTPRNGHRHRYFAGMNHQLRLPSFFSGNKS
jgi:hypothetical protein